MIPLIATLTQHDPNQRPDARGALGSWKQVTYLNKIWRLKDRDNGLVEGAVWDVVIFIRRGLHVSQWSPRSIQLERDTFKHM